mmetsp:Transcript_34395/g.78389  ORF Transcript_34395/g.78389 Transcript_34395/m.78389 type:complete len:708 (+) Transcript_34395:166-2289(+)
MMLKLDGTEHPALWVGLTAAASTLGLLLEKYSPAKGRTAENWSLSITRASLPRVISISWLLLSYLHDDFNEKVLCASLVACASHMPAVEVCMLLLPWLLSVVTSWLSSHIEATAFAWVPLFVLLLRLVREHNVVKSDTDFLSFQCSSAAARGSQQAKRPRVDAEFFSGDVSWLPPDPKQVQTWKKEFNLEGTLCAVYKCALPLHRGTLYMSSRHMAFRGESSGQLRFSIAYSNIAEARPFEDSAVLILKRPVRFELISQGRHDSTASIELRVSEAALSRITSVASLADDLDDGEFLQGDDDNEPETPYQLISTKSWFVSSRNMTTERRRECFDGLHLASCFKKAKMSGKAVEPQPAEVDAAIESDVELERLLSTATAEAWRSLLVAHVPGINVTALVNELMAEEWQSTDFVLDYFTKAGMTDIVQLPWQALKGGGRAGKDVERYRKLEMVCHIEAPRAPLCPPETKISMTYWFKAERDSDSDFSSLTIRSSSISHDVPAGARFRSQETYRITRSPQGGADIEKLGRCVFVQSLFGLRTTVQESALSNLTRSGETFVATVRQRADGAPVPASTRLMPAIRRQSASAVLKMHVWEVQRRPAIWSENWYPPFLPHDGQKRWRWVDTTYSVHPWCSAKSRQACSASDLPPLDAPEDWVANGKWKVELQGGDVEGWLYAVAFFYNESLWGERTTTSHVRRRLWTRMFRNVAE